jgi:hypothetical protein
MSTALWGSEPATATDCDEDEGDQDDEDGKDQED